MSLYVLNSLFMRRSWVIEPGYIIRRTMVTPLPFVWKRRYHGVQTVELRRGVWKSGRGHTDILRFWTGPGRGPTELTGVNYMPDLSLSASDLKSPVELARLSDKLDEELSHFGAFIAGRVGVPFRRVEELIAEPSSGSD